MLLDPSYMHYSHRHYLVQVITLAKLQRFKFKLLTITKVITLQRKQDNVNRFHSNIFQALEDEPGGIKMKRKEITN